MIVILVFVAFVVVGDIGAIMVASVFEGYSETVSLLVFLGLFIGVFCVAWMLAVRVTERFFVPQRERQPLPRAK